MSNLADKHTATQFVRFLWLNSIAMSVVICNRPEVIECSQSKTMLVGNKLDIFVDSGKNQRLQYFHGWPEKRDRPIRSFYGVVLARFRYWNDQ